MQWYPRQSDEECPAGAVVTVVQFVVSFPYLRFTFAKITSLVIEFGNIVHNTYGHCMLAASAVCLLGIRYREMHFKFGKIDIFKDQGKGFVKVLVLFLSMCLIYSCYTRLFSTLTSICRFFNKHHGQQQHTVVSFYSFSIFTDLKFIIASTLIFIYLDVFKAWKINAQEIPIIYRHPCFDFYSCAQILDTSCTSKGIWEWQKFSLAFTSVLYLPHKMVLVRIMLLLKKA